MLLGVGIEVISQVCGNVEDVLQAFRTGALEQDRFALPGSLDEGIGDSGTDNAEGCSSLG